jgi:hydroxymethylpyrimidine pyrophosphatase-like HAD family hydrolase
MQSLLKVARKDLSAYWLLASDVDDTLLGNDAALTAFARELQAKREKIIFALNSSRHGGI